MHGIIVFNWVQNIFTLNVYEDLCDSMFYSSKLRMYSAHLFDHLSVVAQGTYRLRHYNCCRTNSNAFDAELPPDLRPCQNCWKIKIYGSATKSKNTQVHTILVTFKLSRNSSRYAGFYFDLAHARYRKNTSTQVRNRNSFLPSREKVFQESLSQSCFSMV